MQLSNKILSFFSTSFQNIYSKSYAYNSIIR